MTRSRLVVLAAALTVGVGTAAALGILVIDPARAAVGPLPVEGLAFPADTRVVMGFDVKRMVASPFYSRFSTSRPQGFAELEERTGLDPERDIDAIYVASREAPGESDGVVLMVGRFDRYKVSRAIETSGKRVTSKTHHGSTVYLFHEGVRGKSQGAVAFLDDDTLVMGAQAAVEATIATRAQGGTPLRNNATLTALIEKVKPGSTFWMVGDESLLSRMPHSLPGGGAGTSGGGGHGMSLPPLKSVIVTGDLDPMMSVDILGEAKDEAAAKNLADVVRGFVALATLQGSQKPELKQLASAVSVTTQANTVHITGRFAYDALDALNPKKKVAEGQITAPEASGAPTAAERR